MELAITYSALAAGVGLMAAMAWLERRPRESFDVRLVPTTALLFTGALIAILAVVHLLRLYGIELPQRGGLPR